jgi:hypothetical protein
MFNGSTGIEKNYGLLTCGSRALEHFMTFDNQGVSFSLIIKI